MCEFPKTESEFHALTKEQLKELSNKFGRCGICDTPSSIGCGCWVKCKCGWSYEDGKSCRNPDCNLTDPDQ